jgi:Lactonase, 7-bladed beta-propeller
MRHRPRLVLLPIAVALALATAQGVLAEGGAPAAATRGAVFVQTNQPSGNQIVVYDRGSDGRLTRSAAYVTGGNGGTALPGTESDHLASQGSLAYDGSRQVLIAVNAGSDTVSTFRVHGDRLELANVVGSGGQFPASVAVNGSLVYVLNSGGAGSVQGFRLGGGGLQPIPGSGRTLGLSNTSPPNFLSSPGQVGFSPDGGKLIVTTKASGSAIDVFGVGAGGLLTATPTVNASATPVPFAFTFKPTGELVAGEAGASSVTTYTLTSGGTLANPQSQTDGQTALCWIQRIGDFYYVSNTGSNTLSAFRIGADARPTLVSTTGVVATTEPGPIDLTNPAGTGFLYGETGGGTIDEYSANHDGSLTKLGVIGELPAGLEGIASS